MDLKKFEWTRRPQVFSIGENRLEIVTEKHTDLWQRTYYHFRNDSAPLFQTTTNEKFFSFSVKVDFTQSHQRFDQAGIILYLDSENWIKASVEYENEKFQHLGSVVTNGGYSDWATVEVPLTLKTMFFRLSRREDDYCLENSLDGKTFQQMRVCHLNKGNGTIRFGVYACSPEDSSFKAIFTDFALLPCQWKAHDGQQPDKDE